MFVWTEKLKQSLLVKRQRRGFVLLQVFNNTWRRDSINFGDIRFIGKIGIFHSSGRNLRRNPLWWKWWPHCSSWWRCWSHFNGLGRSDKLVRCFCYTINDFSSRRWRRVSSTQLRGQSWQFRRFFCRFGTGRGIVLVPNRRLRPLILVPFVVFPNFRYLISKRSIKTIPEILF